MLDRSSGKEKVVAPCVEYLPGIFYSFSYFLLLWHVWIPTPIKITVMLDRSSGKEKVVAHCVD